MFTLIGALFCFAAPILLWPQDGVTTPIYSIRAANRCNTCHIEPIGWLDPPDKAGRDCTLDCQSCHVNRTGGGLRTPYGRYYAYEVLPTFALDDRPSTYGDPESHRGEDDPSTAGHYSLWEGFSGWGRTGRTPVQEIHDRVGDINPDPVFRAGFDARFMLYAPLDADLSLFPMQADVHLWGRPHQNGAIYGTLGLQGRRARTAQDTTVGTRFDELLTLRELAYEYAGLPLNGYVRAGRFQKPYGWRHPDHTIFTRQNLSYGQYSQVWGVEAGINPNYPFANLAAFYQGWKDFPGDLAPSGAGVSLTSGFRDLGWQAGGSLEVLRLFDGRETQATLGPMWGLNLYPATYLGEMALRYRSVDGRAVKKASIYLYNEINYLVYQGVTVLFAHNWWREAFDDPGTDLQRVVLGAQWDVLPGVQLATQYRVNLLPAAPAGHELLLWTHLWY